MKAENLAQSTLTPEPSLPQTPVKSINAGKPEPTSESKTGAKQQMSASKRSEIKNSASKERAAAQAAEVEGELKDENFLCEENLHFMEVEESYLGLQSGYDRKQRMETQEQQNNTWE